MANLGDFGELEKLWGAVRDIEKISRSKSENKLEEVWNAVKEIPKEQFDVKFESEIIKNIELSCKILLNNETLSLKDISKLKFQIKKKILVRIT